MRQIATALILVFLVASPALAQSGRFPVFGPSAEREDFFAAQQAAKEEAIRTQAELQRAEAEARKAEAEQRAAEARAEAARRPQTVLVTGCYPRQTREIVAEGEGFGLTVRRETIGTVPCASIYDPFDRNPYRTQFKLVVGPGGIVYRQQGFKLGVTGD